MFEKPEVSAGIDPKTPYILIIDGGNASCIFLLAKTPELFAIIDRRMSINGLLIDVRTAAIRCHRGSDLMRSTNQYVVYKVDHKYMWAPRAHRQSKQRFIRRLDWRVPLWQHASYSGRQ